MSAAAKEEKCYCGRPKGHTGRHIGSPKKAKTDNGHPKKHRVVAFVEDEIDVQYKAIIRLKREIAERQHALLDTELKLKPLLAVRDAYENKRIAAPVPAPVSISPPAIVQPTNVRPLLSSVRQPEDNAPGDDATEDDFEPIEADFNTVSKWAVVRNLRFKTWDDLRSINMRRAQFELPPFKKKL